jgi:protein ImuB
MQLDFGAAPAGEDLARLIDRLGARLGLRRVTRFAMRESHIPEFAVASIPASSLSPGPRSVRAREGERGNSAAPHSSLLPSRERVAGEGRRVREGLAEASRESPGPERPVRLFARPEPIEAMAEVPDGPPVRFRWRRVLREVALAEGPERIAMEWWRAGGEGTPTRDYFRVEDTAGRRYWLYREGLYGRETGTPAWFVHGLFA